MSEAVVLLGLRIGAAFVLLLFSGTLFMLLWRDYRIITQEIERRHIPRGRLIVLASETDDLPPDSEFPLMPLTRLGRAPTNTVHLPDSFASNEHAVIAYRSGNWWLEDRSSSNGTFINGDRVSESVILCDGDLLGIGRVMLRVQIED